MIKKELNLGNSAPFSMLFYGICPKTALILKQNPHEIRKKQYFLKESKENLEEDRGMSVCIAIMALPLRNRAVGKSLDLPDFWWIIVNKMVEKGRKK